MKKQLLFVALLCFVSVSKAQLTDSLIDKNPVKTVDNNSFNNNQIYSYVDGMPQFPGGMDSLRSYFSENVVYPQQLLAKHKKGVSMVNFVIEKDGSVSNVRTSGPADDKFNAEAVRVVSPLKFIAATQQGNPVRIAFTLNIFFDPADPKKHL